MQKQKLDFDSLNASLIEGAQKFTSTLSSEYTKLQQRADSLTAESLQLQTENQELREQLRQLEEQVHKQGQIGTEKPYYEFHKELSNFHSKPVHSVATSSDNRYFASGSWDGTAQIFNMSTLQREKVLSSPGKPGSRGADKTDKNGLYAVAFAKTDSNIVGCASCNNDVHIWNVASGQSFTRTTEQMHAEEVNDIDFHFAQTVMVTASDDKTAKIWDFNDFQHLRELPHSQQVYGATFLDEDHQYFVATCCFDKYTRIWDMRDKKQVCQVGGHSDDIIGIDYSAAAGLLATGSDDGTVILYDKRNWTVPLRKLTVPNTSKGTEENKGTEVKRIAFNKAGDRLAVACSQNCAMVFSGLNGKPYIMQTLGGHTDCVFDVAWGLDNATGNTVLLTASHDTTVRCWIERA